MITGLSKTGLTENQVVGLWQDLLASGVPLTAETGEPLQIIYPGRLNGERGADFRDVVISSRRGTDRGQIEFHVRSSDWRTHRHHLDPAYRNVILHVVMWDDNPVQSTEGYIPTLSLQRYLDISLLRSLRLGEIAEDTAAACGLKSDCRPEQILAFIEAAGEARFQEKTARFTQELISGEPGQVLYRGIMGALGYTKNKIPFIKLAGRVPLQGLESGLPQHEIFAALMGVANDWVAYKVRPVNSPVFRLEGMSYLLVRCRHKGLLKSLVEKVENTPDGESRLLKDVFVVSPFIGPDRAAEITVNILLPFAYTRGREDANSGLAAKALELYRRLPGSPANALEKHMAGQFGLSGKTINSALRQQGLLHIYRAFCVQGKCGECIAASCLKGNKKSPPLLQSGL